MESLRHRVRGKVLLLLCGMYFITYMDRVSISTAAPFIKQDLGLTSTQLGLALAAFSIPYAFFQIFGGVLSDKFGPRIVLTTVGVVWALTTVCTGLSVGLVTLFAARLGLGFGEGAAFPTATNAMAKWLPTDRRAFGQGITHAFARIGNAIAPLVVAGLIAIYNWRLAFVVLGIISLMWAIVWAFYYRDRPADHPKITDTELAELTADQRSDVRPPVPWKALFARILPVTFVDFCYGWMLWVYLTWIPSFFHESFGLDLAKFAAFSALVLVAGVFGDMAGGLISDALLRRTGSLKIARRAVLVAGLLGSFVFIAPTLFVHNLVLTIVCLAAAFFLLELTNPVLWAIPMDIAPNHAGTAGGLMNTGFGIAGIVSPIVFGLLIDVSGGWVMSFALSAALLLVGALASLLINPAKQVPHTTSATA
ncbi:major facilitator superfamily transporter ACS family protein [Rhodococcus opacus M213]|uniref:Major facilitator superfamily transporter ACS family protein n=2 Tax=Rhodococcus opacus TaxID=37919 RepID=K8XBB2_RHOOP|nr:major facilitator superfamily transporter ACS family protein [Rhodococcus opacus M213]